MSERVPNIKVLNLEQAESYEPQDGEACISITSPTVEADLRDGWRDVLRLQFHDADRHLHEVRGVKPIGRPQARQILDFARRNRDAERIVVHCEAGVSRSPAVALALHEVLSGEPVPRPIEKHYGLHNRLVRQRLLEVWRASAEHTE